MDHDRCYPYPIVCLFDSRENIATLFYTDDVHGRGGCLTSFLVELQLCWIFPVTAPPEIYFLPCYVNLSDQFSCTTRCRRERCWGHLGQGAAEGSVERQCVSRTESRRTLLRYKHDFTLFFFRLGRVNANLLGTNEVPLVDVTAVISPALARTSRALLQL